MPTAKELQTMRDNKLDEMLKKMDRILEILEPEQEEEESDAQ